MTGGRIYKLHIGVVTPRVIASGPHAGTITTDSTFAIIVGRTFNKKTVVQIVEPEPNHFQIICDPGDGVLEIIREFRLQPTQIEFFDEATSIPVS